MVWRQMRFQIHDRFPSAPVARHHMLQTFHGHLDSYRANMERFVQGFGDVDNKGVTEPNLVNGFANL